MKRYLITGASRGIGRAIAEKLATADAQLILHGRDRAALATTQRLVEKLGADAVIVTADLSKAGQVARLARAIGTKPLTALINNAGIAVVKPFTALTLEEWQRTLAVNVTAPFLLTQKAAGKIRRGGSIVNILSVAAKTGFANWGSYCASKFAFEGFSQAVREELRPRGVRVINIYPAATDTEIWNEMKGTWPRGGMMSAEQIADAVIYALAQPGATTIENITLGATAGAL